VQSGQPISFAAARNLLLEELRRLGVSGEISTEPYGMGDPGVAVYFSRGDKALVLACDRFETAAANQCSIRLAIAAMRQLERHGGGAIADRAFAGFTALPPRRSCWEILGIPRGAKATEIERAFRRRALKVHPDQGGSNAAMAELNAARDEALANCK
jgi:hypothetical protein